LFSSDLGGGAGEPHGALGKRRAEQQDGEKTADLDRHHEGRVDGCTGSDDRDRVRAARAGGEVGGE